MKRDPIVGAMCVGDSVFARVELMLGSFELSIFSFFERARRGRSESASHLLKLAFLISGVFSMVLLGPGAQRRVFISHGRQRR